MREYIDKEKLKRDLIDNRSFYPAIVKNAIENAPIEDVVKVVRCCDCKYCETVIHSVIDEPSWFCTRMVRTFDVDPTSFCSYGERRIICPNLTEN